MNCFIVEKTELMRQRVRQVFETQLGLAVDGAGASGQEALRAIRVRRPDVVFVGQQLDDMSGVELLERLFAQLDYRPLVIFSVDSCEDAYQDKAHALGVDFVIDLNWHLDFLRAAICEYRQGRLREAAAC